MKSACLYGICLACSSAGLLAAEPPRAIFLPTTPWAMDYAAESCRLARNFSDGKSTVTVVFERFSPGSNFRIGIEGTGVALAFHPDHASYLFGPGGDEGESPLYRTTLTDGRPAYLLDGAPLIRLSSLEPYKTAEGGFRIEDINKVEDQAAAQVDTLVITHAFTTVPEFKLGSMVEPVKAVRACADDLIKGWGVDPRNVGTPGSWPKPISNPANWLTSSDYPQEMIRQRRTGVVNVRLIIDEAGAVSECHADTEMLGPFEEAVCSAMRHRARFEPGHGPDGKPVRSYWSTTVFFRTY